ncbi:MAG: DedA family protein [Aphanocapsa sp. GSE-SYN-MK-11-07L]|jgi:membrane protein DedA with SNARE-associated domain|nr:DedA family protein [Aphanocapsa sp. GSE-SYN-MK-11-07L]
MSLEFLSPETIQEIAKQYGYWTVFLGIMLENAGIPLPGETIIIVNSFLAGSGEMSYWWVLACAIAGAILGDNFGYWLGFYGGWPLLLRLGRLFKITEEKLVDIRNRFSHNAARAVFLGRFVALLRIFAGPMAGMAQMPYPQFLLANAAGAVVWAGVTVTIAFFAGKVIPLAQVITLMGQFGIVVVLAIVLFFAVPPLLEYLKHRRSMLKDQKS